MGPMTEKKRPFTRFYHDIEDKLISAKLNGTQWAIVIFIQRNTVGWKGRENGYPISLTKLSNETGYYRSNIGDELKRLEKAKILICVEGATFNRTGKWKINDKTADWETVGVYVNRRTVREKKTVSDKATRTVREKAYTPVRLEANTLKERTKETRKKEDPAKADSRFQPLVDFFQEEYKKDRGVGLDARGWAYADVKDLLKRQPDWSLEYLKDNANRYIKSKDKWHRGQGNPLQWWANNTNAFSPDSGRDNGRGQEDIWNPTQYSDRG